MLKTVRHPLFVKITIGGIIAVFVLIFGNHFSFDKKPIQSNSDAVAKVNGHNIPYGLYRASMDSQLAQFGKQGKIPKNLEQIFATQVMSSLIRESIMDNLAGNLGLSVSQKELESTIKSSPMFLQNGKFNSQLYLDRFRPAFMQEYGIDYEDNLKRGLSADKIRILFENSKLASKNENETLTKLNQTQVSFEIVRAKPTAESSESQSSPRASVSDFLAKSASGIIDIKWMDQNGLKSETTGLKNINELAQTYQSALIPMLQCGLQNPQQFCPQAIVLDKGENIAVRIAERKINLSDATGGDATGGDAAGGSVGTMKFNYFFTRYMDEQMTQADVKTYLQ